MCSVPAFRDSRFIVAAMVWSLATFISGLHTARAQNAERPLTVLLTNGRTVHGDLGEQTDDTRLWITIRNVDLVLSTAFAWDDVESIAVGDRGITKYDLVGQALEIRENVTDEQRLEQRISFWFPTQAGSGARADFKDEDDPSDSAERVPPSQRVRSLEIAARPRNWDRDPELDGLQVLVRPLDDDDRVVAVTGQIRLQLFGQRYAQPTRRTFDSDIAFPQLGTWTHYIGVEDFGPDGAVIRLPFRRLHPQFDTDLAAYALLTARLGISGQGTFDASAADVFIRPPSRYRDELFLRSRPHSPLHPAEPTRRP